MTCRYHAVNMKTIFWDVPPCSLVELLEPTA